MDLDRVTAELRPRSNLEAVDLGVALVRRDFWRCLAGWWLGMGVPVVLCGWLLWDHPIVGLMLIEWAKPAGSRMVLFQLSRRLFGEQPGWKALLREVPRAWGRRFFYRYCWARFSPFLPLTLAVEDLEGLRGRAYQQRAGQLLQRGSAMLMWLYLLAIVAAGWFGMAVFGVVGLLVPTGQGAPWALALEEWDPANPLAVPLLLLRTLAGCLLVAVSLTDLFMIGAGFGLYVNTRTWIEGWDVELAFRRMGQRLSKATGLVVGLACCWLAVPDSLGQDARAVLAEEQVMLPESAGEEPEMKGPQEVIREVKADPDFKVHKVTRKVRKLDGMQPLNLPFLDVLAWLVQAAVVAGVVGVVVWLIWKYRYVFAKSGESPAAVTAAAARVVMGLAVTPESLPADIPGTVWDWWQQGRRQEALGLLYRGTISRVIEHGRVPIEEADTEGDCLRRVELAGAAAFPEYFGGVTRVWIRSAYGGQAPGDEAVAALCRDWPYAARRAA